MSVSSCTAGAMPWSNAGGASPKRGPPAEAKARQTALPKQARLTTFLQSSGVKGGSAAQAAGAQGSTCQRGLQPSSEPSSMHCPDQNNSSVVWPTLPSGTCAPACNTGAAQCRNTRGGGVNETYAPHASSGTVAHAAPRSALAPTQPQPSLFEQANRSSASQLSASEAPQHDRSKSAAAPAFAAQAGEAACAAEASRRAAAQQWQQIKAKYQVVRCKGHNEDCVMRQVRWQPSAWLPAMAQLWVPIARHTVRVSHILLSRLEWRAPVRRNA